MIGNMVGNYKITDKIGEGGMGSVFRGIDVMLEREVAIKMLKPELAVQPHIVDRFRTEAITLAKLHHSNIATLYTFLRQGNDFFMVMEFVRGETLDCLIKRTGAIEFNAAAMLFCQALEGIDYAHRLGIIHRDIKPANMMLTADGSIKVMDFGIARVLGSARMTRQGHIVGTIEYMSPEQVRGLETDARSDIYSLGILLFEILTGQVPFSSTSEFELMRAQVEVVPPSPRNFAANIPIAVEQAIMRSLAKKGEDRYQTANEFRLALLSAIGVSANLTASNAVARSAAPISSYNYPAAEPASGKPLRETRVPGDESKSVPHAGGYTASPESNQLKEAALPWQDNVQPACAQSPSEPIQAQTPRASLLGRHNWKHYAAATTVAVLVCAPIALLISRNRQPSSQPPLTESKISSTPPVLDEKAVPTPPASKQSDETIEPIRKTSKSGTPTSRDAKPARPRSNHPKIIDETPARAKSAARSHHASPSRRTFRPIPRMVEREPRREDKKRGKNGGFFRVFRKVFGKD